MKVIDYPELNDVVVPEDFEGIPSTFSTLFMWWTPTGLLTDAEVMTVRKAYINHLRRVAQKKVAGAYSVVPSSSIQFQYNNRKRIAPTVALAYEKFQADLAEMSETYRVLLSDVESITAKISKSKLSI